MTRQLPDRAARVTGAAGTGWPPQGEGQLPFSLRIGVTGHRRLADPAALVPGVRAAVEGVVERFLGPAAEPALLVISALAEGADRLVAAEVLARPGATMQAVLPLLPAKQRDLPQGDWLEQDSLVCCPDPEERLIMRIERIGRRRLPTSLLT